MADIELKNVQKFFGTAQVIKDMNLSIKDGEFVVMLGQSGCGKTTTLRAIAGLETVTSGEILIDGVVSQDKKAADRDIAFVFQSFSLYPHMTVYENIAFPLRAVRMGTTERDKAVKEVAEILSIPANVTQAALLPVAYYSGEDFKPAKRIPAAEVTSWNNWELEQKT